MTEKFKEKYDWQTGNNEDRQEQTSEIDEVLARGTHQDKDMDQVREILSRPGLHGLVVNRGENSENLQRLNGLADLVIKNAFGSDQARLETVPSRELIKALHDRNIPEQLLEELLASAYHKRDRARFMRIYSIIKENTEELNNSELIGVAEHDMATWEASVDKDANSALDRNTQVFLYAKEKDLSILKEKADFGRALQKGLKPRPLADKMAEIAANMKKAEHLYDAHRAHIEEIKARLELIRRQGLKSQVGEDNMDICLALIKKVGKFINENGYENLKVQFFETQRDIAEIFGDKRKIKQFAQKASNFRDLYEYKT